MTPESDGLGDPCGCGAEREAIGAERRPSGIVGAVRRVVVFPITLYRRFLSPLKPPTCRFSPTCSAYAQEAILVHGVVRGGALGVWRILRCQPFARGGYDPVPPRRGEPTTGRDESPRKPGEERISGDL